jgi:trigger factor
MFGSRVRAEVAEQLVRESFITAATEHELQAVSEPRVDEPLELKKGQDLSFEAIVEVKGEVVAKDYEGMELTKRPVKVEDDAVEAAITRLQREHTDFLPIEDRDTLAESDLVVVSVKGTVGEHDVDQPQVTVDLGDDENGPLPGLREALVGLKLDTKDHAVELAMPEDLDDKSIAGTTASLTLSVIDARKKDVPALDDEFAKDTGKGESLDELRKALREELESAQADQIANETREAALAELVKRNQVPVAQSLVDRVVHSKFHRLQQMMGIQDDNHEHHGFTDDLREKLAEGADDEVRGQLLVEAVATQENIEVGDADLDERLSAMANVQGAQIARVRAEMERDGRLDNLRFQIRHEKTLDLLVSKATVTEKEPEPAAEAEAAAAEPEAVAEPEAAVSATAGSEPASEEAEATE